MSWQKTTVKLYHLFNQLILHILPNSRFINALEALLQTERGQAMLFFANFLTLGACLRFNHHHNDQNIGKNSIYKSSIYSIVIHVEYGSKLEGLCSRMKADMEHFGNLSRWEWVRFMNRNCHLEKKSSRSTMLARIFKKKDHFYAS